MKVKFNEWKYSWDDRSRLKDTHIGIWDFEVNGKQYQWEVCWEEYLDSDGSGKGDGLKITDTESNQIICDNLWDGWGRSDVDRIRVEEEINNEFIDGISVKDFIYKIHNYCYNNIKIDDYTDMDILNVMYMSDWDDDCDFDDRLEGKEKVKGIEFELKDE